MSNIVPFQFEGFTTRIVDQDGETWFVGNDVCAVLGILDPRQAVSRLDDDERGVCTIPTPSGDQQMRIINESGLYSLILTSRKAEAKRFKKWVTSEVLPQIRKTGSYGGPPEIDLRDPLQMNKVAIQLFEVNRELTEKIEQAEKQIEAAKPKTDFYDRFMNADGLINLRGAARALNEPDGKFFAFLKAGIFFYEGKTLVPKVYYREKGYFTVRMTVVDDKARYQAYCTPKGLRWLAKRLGKTLEEAA